MNDIKLIIVGLGNPEEDRQHTRHNIGYMVADKLLERSSECYSKWAFDSDVNAMVSIAKATGRMAVKPLTGMNDSGIAIKKIFDKYPIARDAKLVLVYDDITLPFGTINIRSKMSSSGHKGVDSVQDSIFSMGLTYGYICPIRLRIGVGRPPKDQSVLDFVLGDFTERELEILNAVTLYRAVDAIWKFELLGIQKAIDFLRDIQR